MTTSVTNVTMRMCMWTTEYLNKQNAICDVLSAKSYR